MIKKIISRLKMPDQTPRRLMNGFLSRFSRALRLHHVLGLPEILFIEPTNICSLRCPLCPVGRGDLNEPKGFLSFEDFKRIMDEIGSYISYLTLSNYGESFANNDTIKMIQYAQDMGVVVGMASNGQLIDREKASAIVESRLNSITISLDGFDQNSYEKYRWGGDFSKSIDAIKFIVEEKELKGAAHPAVRIQCLITRYNENELDQMRELAAKLKADGLIFKRVCNLGSFPRDLSALEEYMPKDRHYRAYTSRDGQIEWNTDKCDKNFCAMAWGYPAIRWDGGLYPCCFDREALQMGNVLQSGFRALWNCEKFIALRKRLSEDKSSSPICGKCPVNIYGEIVQDAILHR